MFRPSILVDQEGSGFLGTWSICIAWSSLGFPVFFVLATNLNVAITKSGECPRTEGYLHLVAKNGSDRSDQNLFATLGCTL